MTPKIKAKIGILNRIKSYLFNEDLYLIDGEWVLSSSYQEPQKIQDVHNPKRSLIFCECGNDLVHSNSFLSSKRRRISPRIDSVRWEYRCRCCYEKSYFRPDLGPFIISCNEKGDIKND